MVPAMPDALSTAAIVVALLHAGWALLAAALNRTPDRIQLVGTVATTAAVLVAVAGSIVNWVGSTGPREPATFVGYALTALLLPIGAWMLARMEPTRFGSLIVGVGALIIPVLLVRMGQVWGV